MRNWKDLFEWMEVTCYQIDTDNKFQVRLREIGRKNPSYSITADGFSYFPVTKRMAKKLIKNGILVEFVEFLDDEK